MNKKKINQKIIADNLNLSVSTVSKALRGGYADINEETQARVLSMATQLGYSNCSGSSSYSIAGVGVEPEQPRTYMIGVLILRKMHEWQHTNYFAGMTEKCAKLNVSLVLHYVNEEGIEDFLEGEQQLPAMRNGELSGIILVNYWPDEVVAKIAAKYPCVSIQYPYRSAKMDVIGVDEMQGMEKLIELFYSQGHKKIGFFGNCASLYSARMRFSGYISAMAKMDLDFDPDNIIDLAPEYIEDKEINLTGQVESVIERMAAGVQAWVCTSDWVGYLLCRGLIDRGYSIPKDVSVVGFDDSEDNTLGCPKLTSIIVPSLQIGAEALRRVINRMRHPSSPPLKVMLPCKLLNVNSSKDI